MEGKYDFSDCGPAFSTSDTVKAAVEARPQRKICSADRGVSELRCTACEGRSDIASMIAWACNKSPMLATLAPENRTRARDSGRGSDRAAETTTTAATSTTTATTTRSG